MTVAIKTAVELVHFQPENKRGTEMFRALMAAAPDGVDIVETSSYRGDSPWLMVWGPGAPARLDAIRTHVAAGGRVIAFDLAYWQRDRKVRVSFDAPHPQAFVMRKTLSADRLLDDGVILTNEWNPNGRIVVAGLGDKARVQYGAASIDAWESEMARACLNRWSRAVVYRPKRAGPAPAWATRTTVGGTIEDALRGASLVITWHSNVAVDAIRMGIPVVCRDGAAAAVCPGEVGADHRPMPIEWRHRFLANLAYFQWAPSEAAAFWRFALESLS